MAISDTALRSSVFLEVKGILTSASLEYYDNTNTSVEGVNISAAYVDKDELMPQVVIPNCLVAKDDPSFDRTNLTNTIQVMLDIYTKKAKNIDYITDQIDNLSSLKTIQGMRLDNWEESPAFDNPNDTKVHLKTITLNYKRR